MAIEQMVRTAADNKYVHKDFHNLLNLGIGYVFDSYGADGVREYLRDFAEEFYAPLKKDLCERGLDAIEEHFRFIYGEEEALDDITFERTPDELWLRIRKCPAVTHITAAKQPMHPLYVETTRTINQVICDGTPYAFELISYDDATGASVQRFYRKGAKA